MRNKTLIVIDMQKDFVYGVLGTKEAQSIVSDVKNKISEYMEAENEIIFTRDTHFDNYLSTNEGKYLPVTHCIKDTDGWQVIDELDIPECEHIDKPNFGWINWSIDSLGNKREFNEIELVGVCTDICVVSNALILKATFPEINISVDSSCCAGVTPELHLSALDTMRSCQINII